MPRFINPVPQYTNAAGVPLIEGEMFFFEVGTGVPKDVYLDAALKNPAAHPVLLEADGTMPDTFLSGTYRTVLIEPSTGSRWERNNVGSDSSLGYGDDWDSTVAYNVPDVVLFDGTYYASLTNNNIGNTPGSSPSNWDSIALFGKPLVTVVAESNAAFIPNSLTKVITFEVVGGGPAGGGVDGQGVGTSAVGSSGSGSGYSKKTVTDIEASYNITIGAAGVGSSAANGTDGGATSVVSAGVNIVANGGLGGNVMAGFTGSRRTLGKSGGTATGGDINTPGADSQTAAVVDGLSIVIPVSGSNPLSMGVAVQHIGNDSIDGVQGTGFGGAGSGAISSGVNTDRRGGHGTDGVVIVTEYT